MVSLRARMEMKTSNTKHQTPNKLQAPNSKKTVCGGKRFEAWCLRFFWCLVFGVWCFEARAADPTAVLAGWFAAQANLHTWSADFTQTRSFRTLLQPLTATGHLWLATPDRFRWELGQPAQTIALRARDEMWVIYPRLKRAEKYPLAGTGGGEWHDTLALLEAGFPRDQADFNARFRLLSLTQFESSWLLTLQPRRESARKMLRQIQVGFSTNDFSLTLNALEFPDGSSMK